ncbi:MAG: serine/threonine-protein phosphatase [Actinomycetota bacterium]|jgi:serine phosphatase RsbU (regulator of sigma subunit)|nr:serine/threonine-protein phosphatase [Actinomycetota bacterium]
MADTRNLLRAYAVDRDEPPSALVARLDRAGTALSLDLAATLVVGRLSRADAGAWRLLWSNAGHLPPLLLSAGRPRLLETEPELMLGVRDDTDRSDSAVVLLPGDTLVLYTDGLVERRDRPLDERLDLLTATAQRAAAASPDVLAERLLGLAPGAQDDVALLVVQVTGAD